MQVAFEVKGSRNVHDAHTRSLRALRQENAVGKSLIVSLEKETRMLEYGAEVLPWQGFLDWFEAGELGV